MLIDNRFGPKPLLVIKSLVRFCDQDVDAGALSRQAAGIHPRMAVWAASTAQYEAHFGNQETALRKVSTEAAARSAVAADLNFLLKWPNDVMAGTHKLAGILLEAEAVGDNRLAVVVGIGTNVVVAPQGTPMPATSLAALGVNIGAHELFSELSDAWAEFRGIWDDGRGFGEIRRMWLERAAGLGEPVAVHTGGSTLEGTFDGIDETGCMLVRTSGSNQVPISAGQVYFSSAASTGAA